MKIKIDQYLISPHRAPFVAALLNEHEIMRDRLDRLTVQVERSGAMVKEILDLLAVTKRGEK